MTRDMQHTYYTEKLFFGVSNLLAAGAGMLGAMLNEGDARWVYVTLSVGILVATSMSLMTRREETMRIIAGRNLFAVMTTVLGTRALAHWSEVLAAVQEDILLLGFVSACVCVIAFTVGFGLIRSLDQQKLGLGRWVKDLIITILTKK
jgi:hypothetical protein